MLCSFTHPPSYSHGGPVYPKTCLERATRLADPCGAVFLVGDGKPVKIYEYYPFFNWFRRFITLPNIESYGDKFCEDITTRRSAPANKSKASHGSFLYQFRDGEGKLFVAD